MMSPEEMTDEEFTTYLQNMQSSTLRLVSIIDRVETVLATDIEEFKEMMQEEDEVCVLCPLVAQSRDTLNIPWCQVHQFRGEFINLMASRRWSGISNVEFENEQGETRWCSIARGAYFTATVALIGYETQIAALALAALDERSAA